LTTLIRVFFRRWWWR